MKPNEFKRAIDTYVKENSNQPQTDYLKGQNIALNKVKSFDNIMDTKDFLSDQIVKIEDRVFSAKEGVGELTMGFLMGLYKASNYIEGIDGNEE